MSIRRRVKKISPLVLATMISISTWMNDGLLVEKAYAAQESNGLWLITEEEAAMPQPKVLPQFRFLHVGPEIVINLPDMSRTLNSPIRIDVTFRPRGDVPIDLSSIRVRLLKLVKIDITRRVRKYITTEGIKVREIMVPPGKHRIEFSISDQKGRRTAKIVQLIVG